MDELQQMYEPTQLSLVITDTVVSYTESFRKADYNDVEDAVENTRESVEGIVESFAEKSDNVEKVTTEVKQSNLYVDWDIEIHLKDDADQMTIGASAAAHELLTILAVKSPGMWEAVVDDTEDVYELASEFEALKKIDNEL